MRNQRDLLADVLKYKPFPDCYGFTHSKKDQHTPWEAVCKPLGRWNKLMQEIEDYLEHTKREKKNGD